MILGFLLAFGVWMLMYGLNMPIRWWMIRQHRSRPDTLAVFEIRSAFLKEHWLYRVLGALFILNFIRILIADHDLVLGIAAAALVLVVVWPLYQRSRTRTTEVLVFDREGLTIYPPRTGMLGEGTFQTRVSWKDVFGYSAYMGHLLIALRPLGHVEQQYGPHRLEMERVLDLLGVRKLVAYDTIDRDEADLEQLQRMEEHLAALANDVLAGYASELAQLGLRAESRLLTVEEFEDGSEVEARVSMQFSLWEGDACIEEQDWMVWEWNEDTAEVTALPDDRVYEAMDERIATMIDHRLRALGREKRATVLQ